MEPNKLSVSSNIVHKPLSVNCLTPTKECRRYLRPTLAPYILLSLTNQAIPPPALFQLKTQGRNVSVSAMLVSIRQKNIAQVSILERYFFVSTYQAAGPDTCLAVFVVASLPPCL